MAQHLRLRAFYEPVVRIAFDRGAFDVGDLLDRHTTLAPVHDHLGDDPEAPRKLGQPYGIDCFVDRRFMHAAILNTVFRYLQTACLETRP